MTQQDHNNTDHQNIVELLPWYANGTLDVGENKLVEKHLSSCFACQREYESVLVTHQMFSDETIVEPNIEPGLGSVLNRIADENRMRDSLSSNSVVNEDRIGGISSASPLNRLFYSGKQWLRSLFEQPMLAGVSAVALLAITLVLVNNQNADSTGAEGPFKVLSSDDTQVDSLAIKVQLDSVNSLDEAQALLKQSLPMDTGSLSWNELGESSYELSLIYRSDDAESQIEYMAELLKQLKQLPQVVDSELLP